MKSAGRMQGRGRTWLLFIAAFALGLLLGRALLPEPPSATGHAEEIARSVALVWYQGEGGWTHYGTAFSVDDEGRLLTCAHVVHGREAVTVAIPTPEGEKNVRAAVVAEDISIDAAILQMEEGRIPPVRFGESGAVRVGEEIAFAGFPLGYTVSADLFPSVVMGHVSAVPEWRVHPEAPRIRMFHLDASVAIGHSGSPLISRRTGKVIGMVKSHIHVPGPVVSTEDVLGEVESIPEKMAALTGIGIALPSDRLVAFLRENGIER